MEKFGNSDSMSLGLNSAINKTLHIMVRTCTSTVRKLERVEYIVLEISIPLIDMIHPTPYVLTKLRLNLSPLQFNPSYEGVLYLEL